MAYTDSKIQAITEGVTSPDVTIFAASGVALCRVNQPCDLFAVGALILVTLTSNLATLTVTRRVLPGSAVGVTDVAVVTIPTLTPAGKIVWKNCHSTVAGVVVIAPVKLNAGDELVFTCDSGGGAIIWKPWFEAYPRPESKDNNSDFIKSA